MRRNTLVSAALTACVVGVAACGGGGGGSGSGGGAYSQAARAQSTPAANGGAVVTVKLSKTSLGRVVTDGKGRTLYLFEKDKGPKSTCFGACAAGWPPLTATGSPAAAGGTATSKLGTIARGGGARQVTYAGHPLYYFVGDSGPGQTAGEGIKEFGAEWHALSAAGKKVEEGGS